MRTRWIMAGGGEDAATCLSSLQDEVQDLRCAWSGVAKGLRLELGGGEVGPRGWKLVASKGRRRPGGVSSRQRDDDAARQNILAVTTQMCPQGFRKSHVDGHAAAPPSWV
eukprot:TRINITY_DN8266_c0_g1_i1.p2 TRINITY_DN8266_c0_g1~~TRINITY_DN8266_c0_g1_i1.p2  ORF type:complete len:110 (-),score=20.42 TRINITY_DN8266_c0_g1_i1:120-449(-)